MLQKLRVLTWEYFGECWYHLTMVMVVMTGGPLLLEAFVAAGGGQRLYTLDEPMRFYVQYLACASLGLVAVHYESTKNTAERHRLLPVSSRSIATLLFVIPIATVMACSAAIQAIYQQVLGVAWPIVETTLFLGATTAFLSAAFWWGRTLQPHRIAVLLMIVPVWSHWAMRVVLNLDRNPSSHAGVPQMTAEFSTWQGLVYIAVTMVIS